DGYYDKNPRDFKDAKIIKEMTEIPKEALADDSTANNAFATGGIVTKLKAADFLMKRGHQMFLCNGFDLTAAEDYLFKGEHNLGTLFKPKK
ncbi:MAG TPA: glutamate 5-kinase, partial [Sulfuricurvum sp.]|nr:glutamate 5-kinase [Sulfuricurvum sp.]